MVAKMYLNFVAITFLFCHFGVYSYNGEKRYIKTYLDRSMTAYFSHYGDHTTLIKCGSWCASVVGCRTFYFNSGSCYVLTRDYKGIGTVDIMEMYLDSKLEDECTSKGYTPLVKGLFCVKVFLTKSIFKAAGNRCRLDGGRLLILRNEEYHLKLEAVMVFEGRLYWLGGSDENVEGTWVWSDGSPVTTDIDAWTPGNPSNDLNNEHALQFRSTFKLNDNHETDKNNFICELVI